MHIEEAELGISDLIQSMPQAPSPSPFYLAPDMDEIVAKETWDLTLREILHGNPPMSYCSYQELSGAFAEVLSLLEETTTSTTASLTRTTSGLTAMAAMHPNFVNHGWNLDHDCQKLLTRLSQVIGNNDTDSETNNNIITLASNHLTRCCSMAGFLLSSTMTLYAAISDGPSWCKIAGASLAFFQGTALYAGTSASEWMIRLLKTIAFARGALPDMLRARKFLHSFQTSFLGGRSEFVKVDMKHLLPRKSHPLIGVAHDIKQEQLKAVIASWNHLHTEHPTSLTLQIGTIKPSPSSLPVPEASSSDSILSIRENLPPHQTDPVITVSPTITLDLPGPSTGLVLESLEFCKSPTSSSTASLSGDCYDGPCAINLPSTRAAVRNSTRSHAKYSNIVGCTKSDDHSRKGIATSSGASYISSPPSSRESVRNEFVHLRTKETATPLSMSSSARVNSSIALSTIPEQESSTCHVSAVYLSVFMEGPRLRKKPLRAETWESLAWLLSRKSMPLRMSLISDRQARYFFFLISL
ncbi:hypothetical protein F5146DRAFT_1000316 [Armillaria mellea]|nr:hypothetical protein F5146DRAFT_1000316 [Armillaria mellea]